MDAATNPKGCCPELPKPRSFWQRIADRLAAIIGAQRPATPPEKSVAFSIAIISLGAKLAKADGAVARSEVAAIRRLVIIPRSEEKNAGRVFDLARQERDAWVTWPARVAAIMAAELSAETEKATGEAVTISTGVLQRVLETHVRDQLAALADLKVSLE